MKIHNSDGLREIRIETTYGHFPVGIYEAHEKDGVLTLKIDIDRDAAAYTLARPNIEMDEAREAAEQAKRAEFEAHADLEASREFADDSEATIL